MIVGAVQRWREKRGTYRPAGETIDTGRYEVAPMPGDTEAKAFVCAHHYSGCYPAARERLGLYRGGGLVGVAVFSIPCNPRALNPAPGDDASRVELGRFVLLDDVEANGESWFLARCFAHLRREGYTGVVSFSDPEPRSTADGDVIFAGHLGTIYQATNGTYLGRSKGGTRYLLPDGTTLHNRALAKIRKRDRGWAYSAGLLVEHGADPLTQTEDAAAWLGRWLPAVARRQRHGGNLKYAWALNKRDRKHLPDPKPYPKLAQLRLRTEIAH